MINKIKIMLWSIGILKLNICPICKGKIVKMGFPLDLGRHRYKCLNIKCKFN